MKILINLSNHPSSKWDKKQKEEWDTIIDIPFPNIPAEMDIFGVADLVNEYEHKLVKITKGFSYEEFFVMLQGEFTFCYILWESLKHVYVNFVWHICIPTTERKVHEKQREDGTVEKITVFEFVRWRIL